VPREVDPRGAAAAIRTATDPDARGNTMSSSATQPSSLGLRQIDLLQGLPGARLDAISQQCSWRPYEAGQRLVAREDADRDVHFIVSGTLLVTTYSSGGRETSFRELAPGMSFGELAALDGRPRSADVVALTSGLIASMPPAAFRELLRLVRAGGGAVNGARIEPAPRHTELAHRVSTYREQITRELSALAKAGVLSREGSALVVQDVAQLQRVVEGSGPPGPSAKTGA
jgi:CRP/FNR family transcriptional regulator, cyclic AMP receptor protein